MSINQLQTWLIAINCESAISNFAQFEEGALVDCNNNLTLAKHQGEEPCLDCPYELIEKNGPLQRF